MINILKASRVLIMTLFGITIFVGVANAQLNEVDQLWEEVSRTVGEGDFEGYAATYHVDAVLVNGLTQSSYSILAALEGWKSGFDDTKSGKQMSGVEFRFTQRFTDETTAHDTGIFHYWFQIDGSARVDSYIHFDALLVKKGGWKMMMEYQKSQATIEDWNSAM